MSSCEEVSGRAAEEMRGILGLERRAGYLRTAAEKLKGLGFPTQASSLEDLSRDLRREAEGKRERMLDTFKRVGEVCR